MTGKDVVHWSNPSVILVATNLLEGHQLILHAIYQARLSGAKVLLVHVVPPSHLLSLARRETPSVLHSPLARNVKAKMEEAVKEFHREGIACEPIVLEGAPGEQIPLLVKARSVDRVILATRNTDGIARLVSDSIAEDLIAKLPVPVCVIGRRTHPGAAYGTPPGRVLVATSLSPGSALLVRFASALAEVNRSPLALLHVLDTTNMSSQQKELARFSARKRLEDLIPPEARHRIAPASLVREGDPASVILAEAGSLPEDLIILGSSYRSAISWILGTSLLRRVVIESECPVITVKTRHQAEFANDSVDAGLMLASTSSFIKTENANN
jgi:nucleotide-binding universal stress UspA family protein